MHRNDEELLPLESLHNGRLVIVVDLGWDHALRQSAAGVNARDTGHGVLARFHKCFSEPLSKATAGLETNISTGILQSCVGTGGMATYSDDGYSLNTIHEACWLIFDISGHDEILLPLKVDRGVLRSSVHACS